MLLALLLPRPPRRCSLAHPGNSAPQPPAAQQLPAPQPPLTPVFVRLDDLVPHARLAAQASKQRALATRRQLVPDLHRPEVVDGRVRRRAGQAGQQPGRQLLGRLGNLGLDRLQPLVPVGRQLLARHLRVQQTVAGAPCELAWQRLRVCRVLLLVLLMLACKAQRLLLQGLLQQQRRAAPATLTVSGS